MATDPQNNPTQAAGEDGESVPDSYPYLANVKEFLALASKKAFPVEPVLPGVTRICAGLLRAYAFLGVPLFIFQHNPNFKIKFFVRSVPLVSLARKAPDENPVTVESSRAPRRYLSIGSLPFFDNNSGIPRVAKELTREGLSAPQSRLVPVYPDPVTGRYRIAVQWCREKLYPALSVDGVEHEKSDPEITVREGDWLIHTMINANEQDFMASFVKDFRAKGGKVGTVLYDAIPLLHPEYFRHRDEAIYRRWIAAVSKMDRVFAISHATEEAYGKLCEAGKIQGTAPCTVFHLGADFHAGKASAVGIPEGITARPFYLVVSTIEPRKGHDQTLAAFERLWDEGLDVNLVFVGRKGWKVNALCRKITHHTEAGRRLFWLQGVKDDLLAVLYEKARAVIVPSRAEGFGLSLVEPLLKGQPVIARDIPVFREIAGDAVCYFTGGSPGDLAQAVRAFETSPEKRKDSAACAPHFLHWQESFQEFLRCLD